jgi:hypothetical protein
MCVVCVCCFLTGFQSVRGVPQSQNGASKFQDEEFVIYSPQQQQMQYIIEFDFGTTALPASLADPCPNTAQTASGPVAAEVDAGASGGDVVLDDVINVKDPLSKVVPGLISDDQRVPLTGIHVRARLVDLASQVCLCLGFCGRRALMLVRR